MRAAVRALLVAYFASHIPITLLIDAQAALPRSWFPAAARRLQLGIEGATRSQLRSGRSEKEAAHRESGE